MPTLLLRTYHGNKFLQFDTESSFLLKIHIIFYFQYVKFHIPAYGRVPLDLFQSFLKIELKGHSQFSKKNLDKFCKASYLTYRRKRSWSRNKKSCRNLSLIVKTFEWNIFWPFRWKCLLAQGYIREGCLVEIKNEI